MEMQILRRQAIVEIERYLKRHSSETASASDEWGGRYQFNENFESKAYEDGRFADMLGMTTLGSSSDEAMTLMTQTLRSQPPPHARYRSYFAATPTSTCSDIGALRDPGKMPDGPTGLYLSPTSTQGSLPPLDEQLQRRKEELSNRFKHYSSSSLGDIPEMRSSTMPDMFRLGRIGQYDTLASLPSYEEERDEEDEEEEDHSSVLAEQPSSSSQSAPGIPSGHSDSNLQASLATWRNAAAPRDLHGWVSRTDSTLKHSLEFEQLREELGNRWPNMRTIADISDLRIMETRQFQERHQAGMPLPSSRLLLGNGMQTPSSLPPPGLDRVAPAESSSSSFVNPYNANTGLVNGQAMEQSANPHLSPMASFHF
eukprot:TRINITY_DN6349_c0_g1_i1.p1 TRINITY_DN6349_c0_g1~~TRINITY_DN6349_c0_g1_i1.p1  ORF type:complete len:369 (-),score=65.55 TRINITY_DN6349_c0_g1_i1:308-1414(-)